MAFTLHSHSGEFCPGHARDELAAVVRRAHDMGFAVMGLTEHMPRLAVEDLYPEEMLPTPEAELAQHVPRHARYLAAARALRDEYAPRGLHILVGFEGDWIRGADYGPFINSLKADVDYFIGSVHHVCGEPIDYDAAMYAKACDAAIAAGFLPEHLGGVDGPAAAPEEEEEEYGRAGDDDAAAAAAAAAHRAAERRERALYNAYYSHQGDMLAQTDPPVVGHLDVIRLLSRNPGRTLRGRWPEVWARVEANLRAARARNALLECNASALRKGLADPYPTREIAEAWVAMGGRFCLGDDSHGTDQLGTNYARMLDFLESLGVRDVWTLKRDEAGAQVVQEQVPIARVRACVEAAAWTAAAKRAEVVVAVPEGGL